MNDQPAIKFDGITGKRYFLLPKDICINLQLLENDAPGLIICHEQIEILNDFRTSLYELNQAIVVSRSAQARKRRVAFISAAFSLLIAIVAVFAKDDIMGRYPNLVWVYYLSVIMIGTTAFVVIFSSYMALEKDASSLRSLLILLEIKKKIKTEFKCPQTGMLQTER